MYFHKDMFLSLLVKLVLIRCYGAYDINSWTSQVSDETKLGELAIPGTHDSGAYRIPSNTGETQDWSVYKQLHKGIRFFDIRISNNDRSDDFELRHGILKLGSFKTLVMKHVKNFLNMYPSETIFMAIKDEEDPLDVSRLERDFIRNSAYKFHLSTARSTTRLDAVRGKIVLFRRYSSSSLGTRWNNNDMTIQDEYNLDTECEDLGIFGTHCSPLVGLDYPKKARTVVAFFKRAARSFGDRFFVNFASANYNGLYIGNSAKVSNKAVLKYFQSNPSTPVGCIVPMDYPNRVGGLIERNVPQATLQSTATDGLYGDFGNPVFCPENQFVFGYRLRSEAKQGGGDDTALNDIELRCARKGNHGSYTTISSSHLSYGNFKGYKYCSGSDNPVIGFDMKIEPKQGSGDDTAANKVDLYCKKGGSISAETATSYGSWTKKQTCPSGQAVRGISTRVESDQGDGDDTALNGVRLYCQLY